MKINKNLTLKEISNNLFLYIDLIDFITKRSNSLSNDEVSFIQENKQQEANTLLTVCRVKICI